MTGAALATARRIEVVTEIGWLLRPTSGHGNWVTRAVVQLGRGSAQTRFCAIAALVRGRNARPTFHHARKNVATRLPSTVRGTMGMCGEGWVRRGTLLVYLSYVVLRAHPKPIAPSHRSNVTGIGRRRDLRCNGTGDLAGVSRGRPLRSSSGARGRRRRRQRPCGGFVTADRPMSADNLAQTIVASHCKQRRTGSISGALTGPSQGMVAIRRGANQGHPVHHRVRQAHRRLHATKSRRSDHPAERRYAKKSTRARTCYSKAKT